MSDRSLGGSLGVGALVVAALYSIVPHATTQPQASTTSPLDSSAKVEDPGSSPLSVLNDFLGKGATGKEPAIECGPYQVRFVIATLPDPVDSHFASGFDRGLEAIVGAMSDSQYNIDSWSLPWRVPGPTELQASWATDELGKPRLTAGPAIPKAHRGQPGAVLFRKDKELRLLFLVGETPTHGLQKEAFAQALKAVNDFEGTHPACAPGAASPLPVLAPYFSGTSESLHIALSSQSPQRAVRVLSGSATSDANKAVLDLSGKSSYGSTIHSDNAMKTALDEYFRVIGVTPSEDVALLVEDGTAYGEGFAKLAQDESVHNPKLLMRFPLQISQIRSAYEKLEAARRGALAVPQPHRALEISLEGPGRPKDALSPYESRMTANAAELVLANVFDTVRRQRIRYLGLVASDTRDVLFLARKAREYGADAHLFTFGTDILYQHPDVLPSLDGLLVVTTYPLLGAYQAWHTVKGRHQRSFPGSSEEGIYNAMLFLIDRGGVAADYASPVAQAQDDQDDRNDLPPVWIVANGRHGFWPVWLSPASEQDSALLPVVGRRAGEDVHGWPALPIPNATLVLFLTWSAAASLFVFGHQRYRPGASQENGKRESALAVESPGAGTLRDRLRTFFSGCAGQSHVFMNHAAMAGLFFVFAAIEGSLARLVIVWGLGHEDLDLYLLRTLVTLKLVLTYLAARISIVEVRDLFRARRSMRCEEGAPSNDAKSTAEVRRAFAFNLAALSPFGVFGVLVAVFTVSIASTKQDQAFLFLNRSFDLGSRLGPLLPFCLGGLVLVLFAVCQVQRSILYEEQLFRPPEAKPPQSLLALLEPYGAFTRMIRNPSTSLLPSLAPLVGLAAFHALFVGRGWYHSFDGRAWGALSTLLLVFCGWCVAWSVLEFREIWRRLAALLRILSWSPLADAFNRMPDGLAKSQWRMWRAPPTLTSLHVSVSHLKTLVSLGRFDGPEGSHRLPPEVLEAQRRADLVFNAVLAGANHGYASTQAQRKELRTQLACATMGVCSMLENAWNAWPSKADIADKSDKDQESLNTVVWLRRQVPTPPDVFVRIAEEYVAVRFVSFIHYAFSHMRNILRFALAGFVLLMALIGSYPFQPLHPVVGIAWILGLLGIAGVVWTFVDMDRDLILSYIAKTKPGRVDFNLEFTTNLLVYGVVPLLTLLATQFPEVGDWILSLLSPAMRAR